MNVITDGETSSLSPSLSDCLSLSVGVISPHRVLHIVHSRYDHTELLDSSLSRLRPPLPLSLPGPSVPLRSLSLALPLSVSL